MSREALKELLTVLEPTLCLRGGVVIEPNLRLLAQKYSANKMIYRRFNTHATDFGRLPD